MKAEMTSRERVLAAINHQPTDRVPTDYWGVPEMNPLQWHLPGWNLAKAKGDFGDKVCFHGGVDNQEVLPFKGPEEVRKEVRACMDALYADKTGYILAPCHNVQAITPVENVLAMYDEARAYSRNF